MKVTGKPKKQKSKSGRKKQLTRKDLRKLKQQQKKETKRIFFSSKTDGLKLVSASLTQAPKPNKNNVKPKVGKKQNHKLQGKDILIEKLTSSELNVESDESIASDFSDDEVDLRLGKSKSLIKSKSVPQSKKDKQKAPTRPDAAEMRKREIQRQKKLEVASSKQRIKQLKRENDEEDKIISNLEKKLKVNKSKDKERMLKKMFNDGLDYALEFCLNEEDEERQRILKEKRRKQHQQHNLSDDDYDDTLDSFDNESKGSESDTSSKNVENEADERIDDDDDVGESVKKAIPKYSEDIYGRKRDKDGNVVRDDVHVTDNTLSDAKQKYVPPHQRVDILGNQKEFQLLERLQKNCKGLLNRLSEVNMPKICTAIEELYAKNSRFNMNTTLLKLLNDALLKRSIVNDRMVQEHMVLLAYLHAHIGSEIGAHFLQAFIDQFDKNLKIVETFTVDDKRLNNLILVLSYLYIFKIFEHYLLFDIIARLGECLCEKTIECLLLIFQSVGFKLRKDDPLGFKKMMINLQQKIAQSTMELKENLRLKYMVDVLTAVKNNNINKIPQFDPELAENLRKQLKGMLRNNKYVVTLNITMDDLLRADKVGKWWIVGSAWSGDINDLGGAAKINSNTKNSEIGSEGRFSEKLLELAKKQKMNTDERRNIFCIVMSSEDCVDAFEKVMHLSLKDQRNIASVIIHCCLNEKQCNPYYSHLALKFCNYNRKYQLAFQFSTWDRINDINCLNNRQIKNLANFLHYLILKSGLSLSVVKVVDFVQLNKLSLLLMKEIILNLLLANDEEEIYHAFERVAKNTKLNQFKNCLRLFVQHFLLQQNDEKLNLSAEQLELLKKRINHVDNLLAYVDL